MNTDDMTEPCLDQIHTKCWFAGAGMADSLTGHRFGVSVQEQLSQGTLLVTESYSPQPFQNNTSIAQSQPDKDTWFPLESCRPLHQIPDQVDGEGMKNRNWCPRT